MKFNSRHLVYTGTFSLFHIFKVRQDQSLCLVTLAIQLVPFTFQGLEDIPYIFPYDIKLQVSWKVYTTIGVVNEDNRNSLKRRHKELTEMC